MESQKVKSFAGSADRFFQHAVDSVNAQVAQWQKENSEAGIKIEVINTETKHTAVPMSTKDFGGGDVEVRAVKFLVTITITYVEKEKDVE